MKRLAMLACGLSSVALAQPAFAATGYAGGAYVNSEVEIGAFEVEGDGFAAEGAVAFAGPSGLGAEIDASFTDVEDSDLFALAGHLYANHRNSRVGGFVGLADVEDETVLSIGGEALLYFTDVTLGGAVSYANAEDSDADGVGLDGQARYFINDNVRLDGGLGWASVDGAGGDDDILSFGVGGEVQMASSPVSFYGGYRRSDFDEADITADTFTLGVRVNWGGSLRDRDREGAALAGLSSLSGALGTF